MTRRRKKKGKIREILVISGIPDLSPDVDRKDLTSAENPSTKMATNRLNRT